MSAESRRANSGQCEDNRKVSYIRCICALLLGLSAQSVPSFLPSRVASGQTAAGDPRLVLEALTDALELPTTLAFTPDGRALIAEKSGRIKIWKAGVLYGQPLLDIRDQVNDMNDRGLLGLAVDPDFMRNGFIYVSFVHDPAEVEADSAEPRLGRIVRYTVTGDVARPASARVLLNDFQSETMQHATGALHFAPDGALFAAFGDGALSQGVQDISLRAQSLDTVSGKLLRLSRDGAGLPDNPFYDPANPRGARSRIWAYGFRNPFRFQVHPQSGNPYVADVGWNTSEWIVRATAGANFGWPCVEGARDIPEFQRKTGCAGINSKTTARKDLVYEHDGAPASITGGPVNTSPALPPGMRGNLFYADYSKFWLRRAELDAEGRISATHPVLANVGEPVDLQLGPDGALYVLSIHSRGLLRVYGRDQALLEPSVNQPPDTAPAVSGAHDGDTLLRGARVSLSTPASTRAPEWRVTHVEGRRATMLLNAGGASATFTMPMTLSDTGFVEVLLGARAGDGRIESTLLRLYPPHGDGYIRTWHVLGATPWRSLNDDVLGEAKFSLQPGDKRAWLVRSPARNLNFRQLITPNPGNFGVLADKATIYAWVWIDSPTERAGLLGMNSDDGLAAWLNAKEIWRNKVGRSMPDDTRDIDLPPITLKKGLNGLLLKVDTNGGDWQVKARVLNPDGSIMKDVQIRAAP
jgi:glucose/arabinose dehydrogenase